MIDHGVWSLVVSSLFSGAVSAGLAWVVRSGEVRRLRRALTSAEEPRGLVRLSDAATSGAPADGIAAYAGTASAEPFAEHAAAAGDIQFYQLVIERASDVLIRFSADWHRVFVSPSCHDIFGYEPAELLAAAPFNIVYPDDRPAMRALLAELGPLSPVLAATWRGVHREGRIVWIEALYRHRPEDGGAVAILRDVTRRRLAEERLLDARDRLERMALADSLSGLPNRSAFLDAAERTLTQANELALMFVDLDRFRPINDAHGHAVGDAVLREIATRLTRELPGEPMVARLGADEFAALVRVPNGDTGIAARARDLIRAISEPVRIGEMTLDVGATIGISVCPRDGTGAATMLRNAEMAIEQAKQTGGGTYRFYEPAMAEALALALELRSEFRRAIHSGEVVPWFQPLVRLADMQLVGYEVLARWEHPRHGVLEPKVFLPLAEEIGASAELFATMLRRACTVARDWPPHIGLSVNISPHELHDQSLPDDVARILEDTKFEGTRVEIEITEHALILDSKIARGVLEGLRALGLSVALDDFGTGFSSLYHLRELPFDKVKIDKSFMHALDRDPESQRYVAAIIGLGHALGLELTAEGIEDEATLARLRVLGCTYGQGNVFRRPAPASELTRLPWRHEGPVG